MFYNSYNIGTACGEFINIICNYVVGIKNNKYVPISECVKIVSYFADFIKLKRIGLKRIYIYLFYIID